MQAEDEMAFTAKIRPWGTGSFDFTIQNDTLEPITSMTITMDGTDHEFEYLYASSLSRSGRVLEPSYLAGTVGAVREVWTGVAGENLAFLTSWPHYPNSPNSRNLISGNFEAPTDIMDAYGQRIHGYLLAPDKTPDQAWLLGDTLGWSGPWGTTYASNLRLILPRLSEEQWLQLARQAAYRPPMPNHALRIMEEDDLRSIHRFVVQLGAAGQPAPAALAPGQTPAGPAVLFPAPPAP